KAFNRRFRIVGFYHSQPISPEQHQAISLWIVCTAANGFGYGGFHLLHRDLFGADAEKQASQFLDNRMRYVVLNGKNVVERAVVGFRPKLEAVADLYQAYGYPDALARRTDAAFKDSRNIERPADLADGGASVLERECRGP